jgi:ATP-dependent Lon protease
MERSENLLLPIIPLRDLVVFPQSITPLFVMRSRSLAALERAADAQNLVFLITQRVPDVEEPQQAQLYSVGTVAEVLQVLRLPDNATKVLVEGKTPARLQQCYERGKYMQGLVDPLQIREEKSKEGEALARTVLKQFEMYVQLSERVPEEVFFRLRALEDPVQLAHAVANYLQVKTSEKQGVLSARTVKKKLQILSRVLNKENELLALEDKILTQVKTQIGKSQKEHFLGEQLRAIEKELGIPSEEDVELEELEGQLQKAKLSKQAREKVEREMARLSKMPPLSPEGSVSRNYIEWLLDLPWGKMTRDRLNLDRAQKILDTDHYGLNKIKERILEFLAVRKLVDEIKGPILCFVGPPGVGKTSLARSIARTLGRKFVRVSLGGVRDEAEIRGHRRTYVGALPGKVVQSLSRAGSMNPVFLLDEVDKMSVDFRGDPSAALLEVLDPEQNKAFNDHYLEIDLDLSRVLFITTANTTDDIPPALADRMETVRLPGYTQEEKREIAERFLIPKQLKAHGLTRRNVKFEREALDLVIDGYTREAGVRNLEREIATIIRKSAKEMVRRGKRSQEVITNDHVRRLIGPRRYTDMAAERKPEVGLANGLAWTEAGGELLPTEVTVMKGKGNLILTGSLGEVMQESAQAAVSYIRARAEELKIRSGFYKDLDIHIHVPEGAVPKDGPSAGVVMATALVSALSRRPVRQDLAMTGEITLRGKLLKIGGLKEKALAARRAGIVDVVIPKDNESEIEEIAENVRREMNFICAERLDEAFDVALLPRKRTNTRRSSRRPRRKPKAARRAPRTSTTTRSKRV